MVADGALGLYLYCVNIYELEFTGGASLRSFGFRAAIDSGTIDSSATRSEPHARRAIRSDRGSCGAWIEPTTEIRRRAGERSFEFK